MKKQMTQRDAYELVRPVQAHGMEANISMKPMGMQAPYLSQRGPLMKRKKMVPATEQLLVQVERLCNFGQKRGNGKPDEEGHEEGKPRHVKHAHVWAHEAKELDFRSLVILPGINLAVVGAVILDFLSLQMMNKERFYVRSCSSREIKRTVTSSTTPPQPPMPLSFYPFRMGPPIPAAHLA